MSARDDALEALAQTLFEAMERLEPTAEDASWQNTPEVDRSFYRHCIETLAQRADLFKVICP